MKMKLITLIIDIILTIPLSFIMIKISNKKENFIYSCIIPTIYIIILRNGFIIVSTWKIEKLNVLMGCFLFVLPS